MKRQIPFSEFYCRKYVHFFSLVHLTLFSNKCTTCLCKYMNHHDPNTLFKFRHFWVEFIILLNLFESLSWIRAASRSMQEWNRVMSTFTVTVNSLTGRWFGVGLTLVLHSASDHYPKNSCPKLQDPTQTSSSSNRRVRLCLKTYWFSFSCSSLICITMLF